MTDLPSGITEFDDFVHTTYIYKLNALLKKMLYYSIFLFTFATRAGSPQLREPVTVGPYCLTHTLNFPCGRKPEYQEKTHDFQ